MPLPKNLFRPSPITFSSTQMYQRLRTIQFVQSVVKRHPKGKYTILIMVESAVTVVGLSLEELIKGARIQNLFARKVSLVF